MNISINNKFYKVKEFTTFPDLEEINQIGKPLPKYLEIQPEEIMIKAVCTNKDQQIPEIDLDKPFKIDGINHIFKVDYADLRWDKEERSPRLDLTASCEVSVDVSNLPCCSE